MIKIMDDDCIHGMNSDWCATCTTVTPDAAHQRTQFIERRSPRDRAETKQSVLNDITDLLNIPRFTMPRGGGSSVPKEIFVTAADRFGVGGTSMPTRLVAILQAAGQEHLSEYDSTETPSGGGSTVSLAGLQALRRALEALVAQGK